MYFTWDLFPLVVNIFVGVIQDMMGGHGLGVVCGHIKNLGHNHTCMFFHIKKIYILVPYSWKFRGIEFLQKGHLHRSRDLIFADGRSRIENVR